MRKSISRPPRPMTSLPIPVMRWLSKLMLPRPTVPF